MATSTLADVPLTGAWADLVVTHASLGSADATIQNVAGGAVAVVFGGADPSAAGKSGIVLGPRESVTGNAAAVWARSLDPSGTVSIVLNADTAASAPEIQGSVASGAADSGNPVKVAGVYNTTRPTFANGQRGDLQVGSRGSLNVTLINENSTSSPTISTFSGDGFGASNGLFVHAYQAVFNGVTWDRRRGDVNGAYSVAKPVTSGGLSTARLVDATNGVIKAAAGQLYTANLTNTNAAIRFLQIYDKATAGTLSTDTPVVTIPLPPNVPVSVNFADIGAAFAIGISWQFTTDDVAIPATAGAAADLHGFVTYK